MFVTGDFNSFHGDPPHTSLSTELDDALVSAHVHGNADILFSCHMFRGVTFGHVECLGMKWSYVWAIFLAYYAMMGRNTLAAPRHAHIDWILFRSMHAPADTSLGPCVPDWPLPSDPSSVSPTTASIIHMGSPINCPILVTALKATHRKTICTRFELVLERRDAVYPSDHFPILANFTILYDCDETIRTRM